MPQTFNAVPIRKNSDNIEAGWWNILRLAGVSLELEGATRIVTAGGVTNLTATSTTVQQFSGTTTQSVVLPDATTLLVSKYYRVINISTGTISVYAHDGTTLLATILTNVSKAFILSNNSTSNGTWVVEISDAPLTVSEASAIAAEASATASASSATAAASSAAAASSSASSAIISASVASTSASAAASSATNAAASATAAATSATNAATSATAASSSAAAASTSATAAASSATSSAASATSAAADAALVLAATNFQYFGVDTSWNGSITFLDVDVSAFGTDARNAQWSILDNANSYERMYLSIKATSASNVRITSDNPLAAGFYRLLAPTSSMRTFVSDTSWSGSDLTKDFDVSASIPDARLASWQFCDNANDFEQMFLSIKAISASTVRITSDLALTAGSYRLIGKL